jgi:hypothetical protein
MTTKEFTILVDPPEGLTDAELDDFVEEQTITLPVKMEVCDRCQGHGTHLTPSIGEHAYSTHAFNEAFPEDEDRQEYFRRGGRYDVQCLTCKGANVIAVVDEDACKFNPAYKRDLVLYNAHMEAKAFCDAEDRSEADYFYKASGQWAADNRDDGDY